MFLPSVTFCQLRPVREHPGNKLCTFVVKHPRPSQHHRRSLGTLGMVSWQGCPQPRGRWGWCCSSIPSYLGWQGAAPGGISETDTESGSRVPCTGTRSQPLRNSCTTVCRAEPPAAICNLLSESPVLSGHRALPLGVFRTPLHSTGI